MQLCNNNNVWVSVCGERTKRAHMMMHLLVCVCVHAHQSNYFSSKKVHHTLYKCDIIRYNVKYVEIGAHFEIIESQFGKRKIPQQKTAATWLRWCRRRGEKLLHIAMHRTISTENVFGLDAFLHSILCISLVVSLSHLFSAYTLQLLSLDFTALCQYIGMHALCRPNGIFGQS